MSRPSADPVGHASASLAPELAASENLAVRPGVPEPPESLKEVGLEVWYAVWAAGGDAYHAPTDRFVIERYAALQQRRAEFARNLDRDGFTVLGSQGQEVAHPEARLLSDVESKLVALEDRLGLNPESRLRLGISSVEHKSKLDEFLSSKL